MVRTALRDQDPAAIRDAVARLDPVLDIAEARLARHAFLAGEALTLADIQLGRVLFRYFGIPFTGRTALASGAMMTPWPCAPPSGSM